MKRLFLTFILLFSCSAFSETELVAQCAVNSLAPGKGARINLRKIDDGHFKANLIFGTTISGTTYHLQETSSGIYEGSIKNRPTFTLKLTISQSPKTNNYVTGFASALEATYPTVLNSSGIKTVKTVPEDKFVCGKIISHF